MRDQICDGFLSYARTQSMEHFWAFEAVTELAFQQEWDELWEITLRLIELAPFEETELLAVIAAGPLEHLVRYAAPQMEERIVERITIDPKFRRVLTGVWARQERKDFWDRITPLLYEYPTQPID